MPFSRHSFILSSSMKVVSIEDVDLADCSDSQSALALEIDLDAEDESVVAISLLKRNPENNNWVYALRLMVGDVLPER